MPPRKSNISQISATDLDGGGTPMKERDGINIEVSHPPIKIPNPWRNILPSHTHPHENSPKEAPPQEVPPQENPPKDAPPRGPPLPRGEPRINTQDYNIDNPKDLSLPRTMVTRLAKGVLPPNTSINKDAILAMSKGATVFINYLAQQASESTTNANKRTIPPAAVLEALVDLEFEGFVPRVEAELNKYNELQTGKRNEYRRKLKEEKSGGEKGKGDTGDGDREEEEGRAAKRMRREEGEESPSAMANGSGDGREQLLGHDPYPEGDEGEEEGDGGEDSRVQGEEGEDEDEDEQDEEGEDDDGDEYPDEGRRLSSVEREAHEGVERGSLGYDERGSGSSAGEEGLSDVSD